MRLINASSFELREFDDESQLPPYAILSHTWRSAEVSLEQFRVTHSGDDDTRTRLRNMLGYQKIVKACQQALAEGLAFVWVDTCCIDKSSSAELSEAINSMFRWYQQARVCYAYLDDVEAHDDPQPNASSSDRSHNGMQHSVALITEQELSKARWFTRGWTLQELIAPRTVLFFAKGWKYIGEKASMGPMLERITGIGQSVGRGITLNRISVAKKMSWMARRRTTRIEDLAYSLLGIFDVNMPLLYGEGGKAFVRLQEEIMKDSDDHSLFAFTPLSVRGETSIFPCQALAKHPREFEASSAISASPFAAGEGEPYALTNKGIRVQLRLLPYRLPERKVARLFLAVLECCYEDSVLPGHRPGIIIQRVSERGTQYCRMGNVGMVPVSPSDTERAVVETFYLCKKIHMWYWNT